ncbi:MAG: HD-GYP domain-containing protein [Methylovulum sp.]|nr:HD-GYP domain-containing protein [Methylovulum sp.]
MIFKKLKFLRDKKSSGEKAGASQFFTSSEKLYIPVSQLTLGMYIVELDRSWLDTPFMFQGFELQNQVQLRAVKNICDYVYIDTTKSKRHEYQAIANQNRPMAVSHSKLLNNIHNTPPVKLGFFEEEISRAEVIYKQTEALVSSFMKVAAKGGSLDGWLAKKAVLECMNSVLHSPDAMLWLTQLKDKDEYTAQHSLNVCLLAIVLGRHLDLPHDSIVTLGLCGMMHDIGKMRIPLAILKKQEALDEDENRLMESHTLLGYELLKSSENMPTSVMETALTHHEHVDGTGYPRQLKQTAISDFTKIISVVDVYDSMTSNRSHRNSLPHLDATQMLTNMAGSHLDRHVVIKFIETLGVYPPGSVVLMTNGEIAIVIEINEQTKLRPKVILILDEEKNPVHERVIDLSKMVVDKKGDPYTIKNVIRAEDWHIDTHKYYQQGFIKKSLAAK